MAKRRVNNGPLSSDQEALLAAIRDNPDEDTPRLVYADLLQEIGGKSNEAWAEFIRLQIRLEQDEDTPPNHMKLQARARALLKRYRRKWEGPVCVEGVTDVVFRRGFVDSLTSTADVFVRTGGEWWNTHPIRHVRLEEVRGSVDRVAAVPHLDNVRSLWLADEFRGLDLRPLTKSRRPGGAGCFPALETLTIGGWTEDDDFDWNGVSALAECHMPRLRELELINLIEDDRGADVVTEAPWFEGLVDLDVYTTWIGDAGLAALLTSQRAKNLTFLRIGYGRVTARGLYALADLPLDAPLRWLSLQGSCKWVCDDDRPADTEWEIDPDRLDAVLRKHPALQISLTFCPIPPTIQTELTERFGDRVWVASQSGAEQDDEDE